MEEYESVLIDKIENMYITIHDEKNILNEIKQIFNSKIKGKSFDSNNKTHHGSEGYFIENKLGIKPNSKNEADYKGYEIKKKSPKITFGDWSSSGNLYNQDEFLKKINKIPLNISRSDFIKYFGTYNIDKERYSWSGKCIPKYNKWNYNGTKMIIDKNKNIYIIYSNRMDKRKIKLPELLTNRETIIIQYWDNNNLKKKLENKFNKLGFIIFEKDKVTKNYNKMLIGKKINYDKFILLIKENKIYFDSGMYDGNKRNYSHFRASNKIWREFIVEEYQ